MVLSPPAGRGINDWQALIKSQAPKLKSLFYSRTLITLLNSCQLGIQHFSFKTLLIKGS